MEAKKLINWNDSYSIGNEEIDNQHKEIISMINELYAAFTTGKANSIIDDILNRMIKYAGYHFKHEEDLFAKYDYAGLSEHKKIHDSFVAKVVQFQKDFADGNIGLSYEVILFLKKWLTEHINGEDKKYATYFSDQKVAYFNL